MYNLDNEKIIAKIDQTQMCRILEEFPQQCAQGYSLGKDFELSGDYAKVGNIVFSGMGGSAIGAEIIASYLRKELKIAVTVNREYSLPAFVNANCLVILNSYSGNTEETLSAYAQAEERKAKIIVVSSNGQLAELARKDAHPVLIIPQGLPPRAALAFLLFPVLAIFSRIGLIDDKEDQLKQTIAVLRELNNESIGVKVPAASNPAKKLAQQIFDNFCVIYGAGENLSGVVTRWRGQLAENSKSLASSHLLPEMNHNEIVGWQHPQRVIKKFVVVFLRDKEEHPQVRKRIEISKEILQKEGVCYTEVCSQGEGLLARIFSLIYIGDFVSFYLAILNQEDPTPVKRIDYLKKRLKETQ